MNTSVIFTALKGYGYVSVASSAEKQERHHMVNPLSEKEFLLVLLHEEPWEFEASSTGFLPQHAKPLSMLYILPVGEDPERVLAFLEGEKVQGENVILFDERDEMEFFMKDLWNMVINMA